MRKTSIARWSPTRWKPIDKLRVIAELEEEMREASSRLEFERAAHLRDQIASLKQPGAAAPSKPVKYPSGKSNRNSRVSS